MSRRRCAALVFYRLVFTVLGGDPRTISFRRVKTVYTSDKRPRKTTAKKSLSSISPVQSVSDTTKCGVAMCIDKQTFLRDEKEKNGFSEDGEEYCRAYTCILGCVSYGRNRGTRYEQRERDKGKNQTLRLR